VLHRTASAFAVAALVACALASVAAQSAPPQAGAPAAPKPPEIVPLESLPAETAQVTALRKAIDVEVDSFAARAIEMNDWMYNNPETGFLEFKASAMMGDELKKQGFEVSFGVPGLDSAFDGFVKERFGQSGLKEAFVAKYKGRTEHPVVAFMLEADALREQGGKAFHGCQHNQQGPVAIASAVALARVMEKNRIPGSVWVVFTPAEEVPPSVKTAMTRAGIFDDVDFLVRTHGTGHNAQRARAGIGNCCMLIESTLYEFNGKPAHGTRAWQGRDALDAARLFFTAVDMLREHSEPTFRFMGTITRVGSAPNVVNDSVEVDHWIRNADRSGLEAIKKKQEQVDTIARGAAMATFTEVKIRHYGTDTNGIESGWLQGLAWNYTKAYGDASALSDELAEPTGWDESGIGAVNVPGVQVRAAVAGVPEVAGHSYENAAITISAEGHKGLVQMSKIGAAVGLRLLMDPELRKEVNEEHAAWQRYGLEKGLLTPDLVRKKAGTDE
jgi:amidohydrolase